MKNKFKSFSILLLSLVFILSMSIVGFAKTLKQKPGNAHKTWTIKFNKNVKINTVKKNITVEDSKGYSVNATIEVSGTVARVKPPVGGYEPGEYTIKVSDEIKSATGKRMKDSCEMKFTVSKKISKLVDGEYRISVSDIATDNNGTYMEFLTKVTYFLVPEYIEKCVDDTDGWVSAKHHGKLYYNNNYPIEVRENGYSKFINIQNLKDRTSLTGDDLYYSLFEYYGLSGGLEVSEVFNENKSEKLKIYLSSECEFEMDYYLNNPYSRKKKLVRFHDYVNAIKGVINNSYNGKLEFIEIEVKNNQIVKISEIYRP